MAEDVKLEGLEKLCKGKLKKIPQCFNPGREKYIRKVDAPLVYPLGRHTIDDIAEKAGAVVPINGCILYDTEIINKYIDSFRVVK
ncbi:MULTISPECIES: DUF6462 family protein [unclassified Butyrivibrio]|uniref:DUF6462 family protein n=1 Tax=unclassified Butyrivibrio TaxID=2639466 RepID=UPI0008774006|nr:MULTISPECIES: DUF6462 family protein [unclassified Butyrivibrio]SCY14837.1 hypothetical protein SAMN02910371_01223 [Butyrivibrio sp. INlla14]SDB52199.1 hypothetical protein SAMN02910263_02639 [Butyrivibrio sp. INlla16]